MASEHFYVLTGHSCIFVLFENPSFNSSQAFILQTDIVFLIIAFCSLFLHNIEIVAYQVVMLLLGSTLNLSAVLA